MLKLHVSNYFRAAVLGGAVAALAVVPAQAGGMEMPDSAARQLELSANVALTTDYVFRGFSQTDESAAIQGGFDAKYGLFYAGAWASNLDFGGTGTGADVADIEIDYYAGLTPSYKGLDFDFGVIWYSYPNASDAGAELDYLELKAGVGGSPVKDLSLGFTTYYSPEYTGEIGENWVFEGTAEYSLPKIAMFSPSISGTVGRQEGEEADGGFDYTYWNAGLSLGFAEKFSLDVRYWDTAEVGGCSTAALFQCDERVVGTISASF